MTSPRSPTAPTASRCARPTPPATPPPARPVPTRSTPRPRPRPRSARARPRPATIRRRAGASRARPGPASSAASRAAPRSSTTGPRARRRAHTTSPPSPTAPTASRCARPTPPGNTSASSTSSYTLDTAAPAAPAIGSSPASPGNDQTPSWGFTGEAGASFECRITRGATIVYDWAACSNAAHLRPLGRSPTAPTASPCARPTPPATLRQPRPPPTRSTPPPRGARDRLEPVLSRQRPDAEVGLHGRGRRQLRMPHHARRHDRLRLGRVLEPAHLRPLGRARRRLQLRGAPDRRRRQHLGSRQLSYTLDTAAPRRLRSARARPRRATTSARRGASAARPAASFECRITRGATIVYDWAACSTPRTYDLSAEPDGAYSFAVRQTDAARQHVRERHVLLHARHRGPGGARDRREPVLARQRRDAELGLHGRGRGELRVPHHARRHDRLRLGHVLEPAHLRHLRRARRRLQLRGAPDRRGGQHLRAAPAPPTRSTRPRPWRPRSARSRPRRATTRRRVGASRARPAPASSAASRAAPRSSTDWAALLDAAHL